jgi:hypothetical protein
MIWHHIALCWDMTGEKKYIKMFLDGKTTYIRVNVPDRWKIAETGFDTISTDDDMYLGAARSSGIIGNPLQKNFPEFEIAQFHISDIVRYEEEFTPKQKIKVDKNTLLCMSLSDDLDGTYYKNGKKTGEIRGKQVKMDDTKKK